MIMQLYIPEMIAIVEEVGPELQEIIRGAATRNIDMVDLENSRVASMHLMTYLDSNWSYHFRVDQGAQVVL
jgi:hypothetical protein